MLRKLRSDSIILRGRAGLCACGALAKKYGFLTDIVDDPELYAVFVKYCGKD